ncbi:MAG: transposase [Planctomycetes bacterium]|nr:transposase [Planctomycetota bacterium]
MTQPRKNIVSISDTPYYHCIGRCVRRAFLSGFDEFSGKSFEYRRQWIVDRLIEDYFEF